MGFRAERRDTVSRHRRLDGDEVRGLRDVLGCQSSLVCVG